MTVFSLNDVGILIRLNLTADGLPKDVSSATNLTLVLVNPKGVVKYKTLAFYTDGKDGKLVYLIIAGDLDVVGDWQLYGLITLPAGPLRTSKGKFRVTN